MTERRSPAKPVLAVSPYLSLRQAVRPLVFAHSLLAREEGLAAELAEECAKLARLTRQTLEAAALVHLLGPEKTGEAAAAAAGASRRAELVDAYGKAAALWAEVAGCALALGDALLDREQVDDALRLADFFAAADEPAAANDLRARAKAASRRIAESRLAQIHPDMPESEIASAIDVMRKSRYKDLATLYINPLAEAILNVYLPTVREENYASPINGAKILKWSVAAGDRIYAGSGICTYETAAARPNYLRLGVPAIITKLLVPEGSAMNTETVVATFIRIPGVLANELGITVNPGSRDVFVRLDALAHFFQRIQAGNARTRGRRPTG
jgi:hypothetical protein